MAQKEISESKRRKLEKKKIKKKEERRKRINAKIDRTIVMAVILIYAVYCIQELENIKSNL